MTSYPARPIDLNDLTVDRLGKRVTVGDGSNGYLLGPSSSGSTGWATVSRPRTGSSGARPTA
jgi:hypothetical protein